MSNDLIDDSSVLLARNETQERAILALRDLLKRLRTIKPPHAGGMVFLEKGVDLQGNVRLRLAIDEGLRKAQTVLIEFNILQEDYRRVVHRIENEYIELCRALFRATYDPDSYIADVSGVDLTEARTMKSMDLM